MAAEMPEKRRLAGSVCVRACLLRNEDRLSQYYTLDIVHTQRTVRVTRALFTSEA